MTGNSFLFGLVITAILLSCVPASASEEYILGIFGNANGDDTIDLQDVTHTELIIMEDKDQTQLADAKYDECNEMLKRFYGVDGLWTEMAEKCDLRKWGQ